MTSQQRALTEAELFVLGLVQEAHGPLNQVADIFFSDSAEAVIAARDREGETRVFVNLTNLAEWHGTGQISLEELKDWISPETAA